MSRGGCSRPESSW
eukprot:gene7571-biopygen14244